MAKGRFKDRKVDTAVDAVNLAERVGHWRHVTALSVSVKCADIPGRVGECPPGYCYSVCEENNGSTFFLKFYSFGFF